MNAILDAKVSIIPVLQALSSAYNENKSCVKCWSSFATPNKVSNFKIVPEWVKYADTNNLSSDL